MRHDKNEEGKCAVFCRACKREKIQAIYTAEAPPHPHLTWVSYAIAHQHVGTECWQCAAGERAMDEHAALEAERDTLLSGRYVADRVRALDAENKRLREALEFVAAQDPELHESAVEMTKEDQTDE